MRLRIALVVSLLAIVWLCAALVRVENERYALQVGLCRDAATGMSDSKCLSAIESRTGWWWHLLYALKG
jgi:hypothetical protein